MTWTVLGPIDIRVVQEVGRKLERALRWRCEVEKLTKNISPGGVQVAEGPHASRF